MKAIGLVPPETELSPGSDAWSTVPDKAWEARCKEVYAAKIHDDERRNRPDRG